MGLWESKMPEDQLQSIRLHVADICASRSKCQGCAAVTTETRLDGGPGHRPTLASTCAEGGQAPVQAGVCHMFNAGLRVLLTSYPHAP